MATVELLVEKPCSKCARILPAVMFNKAKWLRCGLRPDCKECYSAAKKAAWAAAPKSGTALRRAENALLLNEGRRRCAGCGQIKPATDEEFSRIRGRLNTNCRPCDRAKVRAWAAANEARYKAKAAAGWALRNAGKKLRTLALSREHRTELRAIYAECRRRNAAVPRAWHVDHIMPLAGRDSCGLHVPWNLQILTGIENTRKSNRTPIGNSSLDAATVGARSLLSLMNGNGGA